MRPVRFSITQLLIISAISVVFYQFLMAGWIQFRLGGSSAAFEILSRKNYIRPLEYFKTRLECAREIYDFYTKILERKIAVRPADYERVETLIEEFSDEIALIKVEKESDEIKSGSDVALALVSWRLATYIRGVSAYPLEDGGVVISPAANISLVNSAKNLWLSIGLRSRNSTDGFSRLKVDEASVGYEFASNRSLKGQFRAGRIYFLLGHLGLIGDNNFDAFEGGDLDIEFLRMGLKTKVVFSRLSSTNYPRTREFESCDDYWAARVSKEFARGNFEIGVNALLSGIASEDAASLDMWWRTPFKGRQMVMEYALYRPTKSGISLSSGEEADPYKPRYAFVGGFDVVNADNLNVFVQLGDVQKGFAPMATSLAYSAQEHLYFDPDTRGIDISLTYYPSAKDETEPWSTRPPVRNLELPRSVFYELNAVYLWRSENSEPSQGRYILRHGRSLLTDVKFYIENTIWEKYPTDVWVYDRTFYNETKVFLVYEF